MRAPSTARPGVAYPARIAFTNAHMKGRANRRVALRAETENVFAKIGTQLVKAGSQFTERLTGTGKVSRRGSPNDKVVFIAGATGRLGSRIVMQALQAGFRVRAGCRDVEKGEQILSKAPEYEQLSNGDRSRLDVVEFNLFDEDTIAPAIGNAGVVVSALGAPESRPFDVSGPKLIDGEGSIALVEAARDLGVNRFIMVTSLGTTKFGWPASALNLFWGVLYWKAQAEKALVRSGMAYTIVRPGGMERPKDDYKEAHATVLAPRDTYFGNQISRLQVAELIGACLINPELSGNKTLEAVALEDAPQRDLEDLLEEVEAEISMDEMRERQAAIEEVRSRARSLESEAERLEEQLAAAEESKVNAEQAFSAARSELQEVKSECSADLRAADQASGQLDSLREQLDAARRQEEAAKAVLTAQRTAGRSGEVLSRNELRDIQQPILNPEKAQTAGAGGSQGVRGAGAAGGGGFLGSLFGGTAQATVEEAAEEVEEQVEEAPRKAARGLSGLFGRAKDTASDIEDEVEEQAEAAAPKATKQARRGLGGLFGGAKDAAEEVEEQVEKKAPQAKQAARQAQSKAQDVAEDVQETVAKTTKGGGLFGMFQQDTIYADEAQPAPPSQTEVERAVTKRGMGPPKRRKGGAKQLQASAKEAASTVQDAAKGAAKKAEEQAPAAADKVKKAAEDAPEKAGNFFSGLFSNASKAVEDLQGPAASAAEDVKDTASKAASEASTSLKQAGEAGRQRGTGAAKKSARGKKDRAAAIGDAIKSFESAAEGTAKEAGTAADKGAETVEKSVQDAGKAEKSAEKIADKTAASAEKTTEKVKEQVDKAAQDGAKAANKSSGVKANQEGAKAADKPPGAKAAKSGSSPSMNGATPGLGGQEGARKWIATWREKQKA